MGNQMCGRIEFHFLLKTDSIGGYPPLIAERFHIDSRTGTQGSQKQVKRSRGTPLTSSPYRLIGNDTVTIVFCNYFFRSFKSYFRMIKFGGIINISMD